MNYTQTLRECWDSSRQSTAEHTYPKRLLMRLGHTLAIRLMSANPHGYPVPGRDGRGRVVEPLLSINVGVLEAEAASQEPAETTVIPSAFPEAPVQPQDLLSQPTIINAPKPENS